MKQISPKSIDRIMDVISLLPKRTAEVLNLRGAGISYREIGNRVDLSEGMVQQIYVKAVEDVRRKLGQDRSTWCVIPGNHKYVELVCRKRALQFRILEYQRQLIILEELIKTNTTLHIS